VVELHAAHGYLVHQFLSPVANHRTDAWGGDFEGRTRLARTIARRLRHAIGPDAVLAVRLSATDWIDGGWDGEQTVELARRLVSDGVDHLDISTGGIDNPPIKAFPGYQVPFAAQVRAGVGQAAGNGADATGGGAGAVGGGAAAGGRDRPTVSAVGVIVEAGQAEKILADGAADAVMLGRKWLQNPHVASDWAAQLGADLHGVVAAPLSMVRWGR
jgi:2,4-dienoyl-CoA reductase-like NADH-dependent reductase (Old Yellow Enzyme family)